MLVERYIPITYIYYLPKYSYIRKLTLMCILHYILSKSFILYFIPKSTLEVQFAGAVMVR